MFIEHNSVMYVQEMDVLRLMELAFQGYSSLPNYVFEELLRNGTSMTRVSTRGTRMPCCGKVLSFTEASLLGFHAKFADPQAMAWIRSQRWLVDLRIVEYESVDSLVAESTIRLRGKASVFDRYRGDQLMMAAEYLLGKIELRLPYGAKLEVYRRSGDDMASEADAATALAMSKTLISDRPYTAVLIERLSQTWSMRPRLVES